MLKTISIFAAILVSVGVPVSAKQHSLSSKPPIPGAGKVTNQNQQKTTTNNQPAHDDKRGTSDSPLIIEMANPPNADTIATELKKNREDQTAENRRASINILLVLVGIGQGVVLFYTALVVNKSANAAQDSADAAKDALIATARPKIIVRRAEAVFLPPHIIPYRRDSGSLMLEGVALF